MNVIFTCGGTGGHINPAIAVANIWKERHPNSKILFIGGYGGMEEQLVPDAGFEQILLPAYGIRRGHSLKNMAENIRTVNTVLQQTKRCKKIIRDFGADVVVGTGGYASFPALLAASRLGVPTCVHEANAMPGLTTRLIADKVDRVLVCFPASAQYYRHPKKVEVVGMPVRREFFYEDRQKARRELGLDDRPLVVSAFGSQGARAMNEAVADLFALEQKEGFPFQHIHAVGKYGWDWMPELIKSKGVEPEKTGAIEIREYIYNMPTVMAAADVFISRAGSSSCNEIAASGTPCILIPSPNVTDNHQEKNARAMLENGAAVMVLEKDCTPEVLMTEIKKLLSDRETYSAMRRHLQEMSVPDCAERICTIMDELAGSSGK